MFDLELINLINEYKKTQETYERNKIKKSISNLIKQNPDLYQNFIQLQQIDLQTKQILNECETEIQNNEKISETKDDFEIIKTYFYKWLEIYNQNGKEVSPENTKIVTNIINHYLIHRYDTLEKIFELTDGEDFESFKWHIKNELRIYYINQIRRYRESENYKNLNFIKKIQKDHQINLLINDLGKYIFKPKHYEEVLN